MGVQKHNKKRFTRKSCRKKNSKKIDKKSKTDFCRFVLSRFWAFPGEGSSKTPLNKSKNNLTLVLFWPLTHPPTTGVADFFFAGPLPKIGTEIHPNRPRKQETKYERGII
jgi:hypothetical protein